LDESFQRQMYESALRDGLTKIFNKKYFMDRLESEFAFAVRHRTPLSLIMFDIDYFKRINDERGHEIGDRVLARIGQLLAAHARDVDVVARLGGEEFVALLPGCASSDAAVFAERVREALAADDRTGLPAVRVSAGVLATLAPTDIEAMLHGADSALYGAKRRGRDRTVIAEADARDEAQVERRGRPWGPQLIN
jgi:diguanylate cyclase (GGDEF)-like protein